MKKLTLQEIKDTLVGCTILGTGGGGSDVYKRQDSRSTA